ncbi:MAG: cytochrome c [Pseudomonadota bacterium]|jgi:cytochrome c556|nr:cytochrome c [Pseudomonadota bacterium]
MSLKTISAAALAAALLLGASGASAQDPAAVAKARHDHFKEIGKAFKGVLDEFKKPTQDMAVIQANAKTIDMLAAQVPTWFPAGTGRDVVPKSEALPAVWQKPDEFKKDAANFATAAHAFNTAAQSGNAEAVRSGIPALGGACKACHEVFRAKDEH